MDVTPIALESINAGVSTAYNTQFDSVKPVYTEFTYEASSTGDEEVYPRVDLLPGMREWIGERRVNWLTMSSFKIQNRTWEGTIGVKRENIEDDKYGFLTQAAAQMGLGAARLPDLLIAQLMAGGTAALCPDNANFFDLDHENYSPNGGGQLTTNANYQPAPAGYTGPSWYLMATADVTKPFIYQKRRAFVVKALFDPSSPDVFYKNEFMWGNDGRCNAGYGLWHYVFRSDAQLNVTNLIAAREALSKWNRPDGSPLGILQSGGIKLVTGVQLGPIAKTYCTSQFLPAGDPLAVGGTVTNMFQGYATPVENPWIP